MEWDEKTYILGLWCAAGPMCDVMFSVARPSPDAPWQLDGRFRYYDPEDPANDVWSGKDQKEKFHMAAGPEAIGLTEDQLIERTQDAVAGFCKASGFGEPEFFEVRGGVDRLHELIKGPSCPHWLYFKEVNSARDLPGETLH